MNTEQDDSVMGNNKGMLEGHAFVWAVKRLPTEDVFAVFVCPGTGEGKHCLENARRLARLAGFEPLA